MSRLDDRYLAAKRILAAAIMASAWVCISCPTSAQQFPVPESQAKAVTQAILLGVQQGISSLPPSAAQSFSYEFDPKTDTFAKTSRLGPTVFRSPLVLGKGKFGVRASVSYFELSDTFEPVDYEFLQAERLIGYTQFGLRASADVTLVKLAANYGLTERLEFSVAVPLVVVNANASTEFPVSLGTENTQPPTFGDLAANRDDLPALIGKSLVYRRVNLDELGSGTGFSSGTNFGLGRISLSAKGLLYKGEYARLGVESELFFPSPNEDEFAGPDSFAVLPRAIGSIPVREWLSLYADLGYDYDFDTKELRRLVWDAGFSAPFERFAFDFGVGGSEYAKALDWTPAGPIVVGNGGKELGRLKLAPDEDNQIGTTFIDLLIAVKVEVVKDWVVSAAVAVPVDTTEFRPDALITLGIETAF